MAIELTNPYVLDVKEYIFSLEGIWEKDMDEPVSSYTPPKKVVLMFENDKYVGHRYEGFNETNIVEAEDIMELHGVIANKVKELKGDTL